MLDTHIVIYLSDAAEEEVAAVLAAVALLLEQEQTAPQHVAGPWQWRASAAIMAQRIAVFRPAVQPHWGAIERIRRNGQ
ncbi:hypothetical protein HC891_02110 [Candidatus Gracilibacteria bacterium]|nr:hypothetical protein [Candidatus Gracilibacteria bacterium]